MELNFLVFRKLAAVGEMFEHIISFYCFPVSAYQWQRQTESS